MVNMGLISCNRIRPSIGTENLIPEKVNYTKITIRMTVMNKVQLLAANWMVGDLIMHKRLPKRHDQMRSDSSNEKKRKLQN